MAGLHHCLDGRESEWTPGVGDGQGGLVWCDSWGGKESDTTERLNWTDFYGFKTILWKGIENWKIVTFKLNTQNFWTEIFHYQYFNHFWDIINLDKYMRTFHLLFT